MLSLIRSNVSFSLFVQMEDVIARMQDEKNGIPIRTVKSFLSKIPSVFSGKSPTSVLYTLLALVKQDSAGASAPQQA